VGRFRQRNDNRGSPFNDIIISRTTDVSRRLQLTTDRNVRRRGRSATERAVTSAHPGVELYTLARRSYNRSVASKRVSDVVRGSHNGVSAVPPYSVPTAHGCSVADRLVRRLRVQPG